MSLISAMTPVSDSTQLGRYSLLFRFAAGGMAEVFVGRMQGEGGFEKPVAIKRMLPALAEEPRFVDMFLDEARIAAMVSSPHVVPTLDVGKDEDGSPYIVMELVTGLSLSQVLRFLAEKKTLAPLPMIVDVLAQTAQGLDDAHVARRPSGESLGIIHRDVSPQNVLVGVDGRARLTDFGVARALERVTRTTTGEVKGKLSYFSPEQAKNLALDQRSDVFALGVVAWEAVTGHRLFQRDNPVLTLKAILEEPIPEVTRYRKEAPEALANAIALALARDRELRHQTAGAFAQALRATGIPVPSRGELGAWVEASGGERLKQFQARIAQGFSGDPASRRRDPSGRIDGPARPADPIEREPVESSTRARTHVATPQPAPLGAAPEVAAAAPLAPPVEPSRSPWRLVAAAALVAVAFAVGFFLFGRSPSPEATTVAGPPPAPAIAAPEVEAPVAPPPVVAPPEETPSAIVAAPAPMIDPPRTPERGRLTPRAVISPPPPVIATPLAAPPPVVAPPTPPPVVVAPPPEPEPEPVVVAAPPPRVRETTPPPPAETAPTPPPTGRRGRLLGLDQFQRETTTP